MAAGVREGFVEADGLGIRYMEAGEGPALARAGTSAIGASRPVAAHSDDRLLSEHTPGTHPCLREPLFMPRSSHNAEDQ